MAARQKQSLKRALRRAFLATLPVRLVDVMYLSALGLTRRNPYPAILDGLRRQRDDRYSLTSVDRLGAVFVRVPKCATESIATALFGDCGCGHLTINDYRLMLGAKRLDRCFSFAFVRNPWDRLVSAYYYLLDGGNGREDEAWLKENRLDHLSFDGLVEWLTPERLYSNVLFRPQTDFVCDWSGSVAVDFVGRFESLIDDFHAVRLRLGLEAELPHVNQTRNRPPPTECYTDDTSRQVGELYRRDAECLGYEPPRAT